MSDAVTEAATQNASQGQSGVTRTTGSMPWAGPQGPL